ncbi:hypothetical protein LPJ61_002564 [Coemansia biformis]|uniref:Uncharacterized protein n=1 Tax=Coemansia biformis TaxID=1286918 RepID=A0A9W7YEJ5_9FUNG|nr:hypothetical protein LPJ61_002564 [Coemansia biformis]
MSLTPRAPARSQVKQLSSVRAWRQTCGMGPEPESDTEVATYESFPDLRRLLEEECAEIERRELEAKATLEERIRRRNSDPLGDAGSASSSRSGYQSASEHGGFRIIGSLYRLIDPIMPAVVASASGHIGSGAGGGTGAGGS